MTGRLDLDPDDLAACVSCGLCLPHCPTYRVTGQDTASPRGRITLMRAVEDHGAPLAAVAEAMASCVQCMGCETACPSGVPFGRLMHGTRAAMAEAGHGSPPWLRWGLSLLGRHRLLLAGSSVLAVVQRLGLLRSGRNGLPRRLPLRRPRLRASGDDVWLFTGCVMDAWQRDVHLATQRVVEATGTGVRPTGSLAPCCGALHGHAGLADDARRLARRVVGDLAGEAPVLVDSAGCGAALKGYGELLGTPEARRFSARVHDVHEWLAERLAQLELRTVPVTVAVQDPCHLRHVQRVHEPVAEALSAAVEQVVVLADDGLCCGAGGSYSLLEPELAAAIRERKVAAIQATGAAVVASANPGCALHLAAAGLDVRHPMELVAAALAPPRRDSGTANAS